MNWDYLSDNKGLVIACLVVGFIFGAILPMILTLVRQVFEWPTEEGWRVLNYMPRKERCQHIEQVVTPAELPVFCKNTATVLRNLADLFEALGEGKIKTIYYPDQTVAEAMKDDEDESLQPGQSDLNSEDAHNHEGEQDDPVGNEGA